MSQSVLSSRFGFEVELLAPHGVTRADLAEAIARNHGGIVRAKVPMSRIGRGQCLVGLVMGLIVTPSKIQLDGSPGDK